MNIKRLRQLILPGCVLFSLLFGFTFTGTVSGSNTPEINENAFVYILNMGIEGTMLHYGGLRNGFAVGDGQYVLTAAHCADDFKNTNKVLCQPLIISPYYGDIFEAEIVAIDDVNDIAILKPGWDAHPALELETSGNWKNSRKISITGYPPIDKEKGGNGKDISRNIERENVGIVDLNGEGNRATIVGPVKYVAEGWSGSAFIVPETGKVAGITCTKFVKKPKLQLSFLFVFKIPMPGNRYITGCRPSSILSLFEQHQLTYGNPKTSFPDMGGKRRFDQILAMLDTLKPGNEKQFASSVHNLYDELPDSDILRFMTGAAFPDPNNAVLFEKMVETAPDSGFTHAAYGNYLMARNKLQKAVEQFQFVTDRDPNHIFACHGLLSALVKTDPNAAEVLGQELTQRCPENAGFCFEYSKALRERNKRKEELPVIQKAVKLCDPNEIPYEYLRYLADSLAANHLYEQAEQAYIKLLEKHECDRCWWAYTVHLLEMGPDKIEQAKYAYDKTMTFVNDPNDVAEKQRFYEAALEETPADPNTSEDIERQSLT